MAVELALNPNIGHLKETYDALRVEHHGFRLYKAGLAPNGIGGFPRLFFRDGIAKEELDPEEESMADWLRYGAFTQGKGPNSLTGELRGAIPHEIDPETDQGFEMPHLPGMTTLFNGHDNAAHWLNGFKLHKMLYNNSDLVILLKENIMDAGGYIRMHVGEDGLFKINPALCGAQRFALKVTYWKDSDIPGRENGEFSYPAVITLAHIQNMTGLASEAYLLGSLPEYAKTEETEFERLEAKRVAALMRQALIENLYDEQNQTFIIASDTQGPIKGIGSDALHALYYLRPDSLPREMLSGIYRSARTLETQSGYVGLDPAMIPSMRDLYHVIHVWPFEQAFINAGARVHLDYAYQNGHVEDTLELARIVEVSQRVMNYLVDNDSELLDPRDGVVKLAGCNPQLWTKAAKEYFKKVMNLPIYAIPHPIPALKTAA